MLPPLPCRLPAPPAGPAHAGVVRGGSGVLPLNDSQPAGRHCCWQGAALHSTCWNQPRCISPGRHAPACCASHSKRTKDCASDAAYSCCCRSTGCSRQMRPGRSSRRWRGRWMLPTGAQAAGSRPASQPARQPASVIAAAAGSAEQRMLVLPASPQPAALCSPVAPSQVHHRSRDRGPRPLPSHSVLPVSQ
jgi:hypothetical protein